MSLKIKPHQDDAKLIKAQRNVAQPRAKPKLPTISTMVMKALIELNERTGSSLYAIKTFIASKYEVSIDKINFRIKKCLKSGVLSGEIIQTKGRGANGSFKISKESKKTIVQQASGKSIKTLVKPVLKVRSKEKLIGGKLQVKLNFEREKDERIIKEAKHVEKKVVKPVGKKVAKPVGKKVAEPVGKKVPFAGKKTKTTSPSTTKTNKGASRKLDLESDSDSASDSESESESEE